MKIDHTALWIIDLEREIPIHAGSRERVDSLTETMRMEGVVIESEPRVTGDGYYESIILDRENNKIEIISE